MEYYSVIEKNEIFPFTITWMGLVGTMLSEIREREKDILYIIKYIWKLKINKWIKQN